MAGPLKAIVEAEGYTYTEVVEGGESSIALPDADFDEGEKDTAQNALNTLIGEDADIQRFDSMYGTVLVVKPFPVEE